MNTHRFYQLEPGTAGLERLDVSGFPDDWTTVRDLAQHDLAALDGAVAAAAPSARIRAGSNRGGGAHLFVYRVYGPEPRSEIDPVVVGILVGPIAKTSDEYFHVSGDIAGESLGDVLFEEARQVMGWSAMTEAVRDVSSVLVRQAATVLAALKDASRRE